MADKLPEYKIFAIRYATREARRADHFIGGDPHYGPMPHGLLHLGRRRVGSGLPG